MVRQIGVAAIMSKDTGIAAEVELCGASPLDKATVDTLINAKRPAYFTVLRAEAEL